MPGLIPQSFVNSLIERVDIVEVVGSRVQLKKAGANHMGLCPFHDEKTPSFHVYADGHYHCFGCGAHGTTIGFLMDVDALTFPEAVEAVADMLGLEVPREGGDVRRVDPGIYDVLNAASTQFKAWLRHHDGAPAAVAYLKERGLSGEVARDFNIGFAPPGWDGLKTALASFGEERLVAAGLLARSDAGRTYDRFRQRIVFPIRDARGRVIGFGGRIFGPDTEGQPKYLNSPETDVFHKGQEVYGLFEARRAHNRLDTVVVVEGYMDVVALAQYGIHYAVATLGTAIGTAHFARLYKVVDRIVCCFDGDDAGREAAWKAVNAAFPTLSAGRRLDFVFLPEGEDPDTVVRKQGAAAFNALVADACSVGRYFLERLQAGLDLGTVDDRATLAELALPLVGQLPVGELRAVLLRELARLTRSDFGHLEQRTGVTGQRDASAGLAPSRAESKLATTLLRLLVRRPRALAGLDDSERQQLRLAAEGTLREVLRFLAEQPEADTTTLLGRFVGDPVHPQLVALCAEEDVLPGEASDSDCRDCARRYLHERNRQHLLDAYRQVGTDDAMRRHLDAKRQQTAGVD